MGKTAVALTVLHHERIVQKFSDQRRFIRCDEFPTSIVNFLDRLSTVIGAGMKNVTSLVPLRSFITTQQMILVLDNAETILDPHVQDAHAIYLVVEELSQFPNLCLIITSRLSTISLLWEAKRQYFSRLHLVDEELQPVGICTFHASSSSFTLYGSLFPLHFSLIYRMISLNLKSLSLFLY